MQWEITPEAAFNQLYEGYTAALYNAIYAIAQQFAPKIEAWMKTNASWTDRTGNARQALYADTEALATEIVIFFDHGMEYGFWLEVKNQGAYAIIGPALDKFSWDVWKAVEALLAV